MLWPSTKRSKELDKEKPLNQQCGHHTEVMAEEAEEVEVAAVVAAEAAEEQATQSPQDQTYLPTYTPSPVHKM